MKQKVLLLLLFCLFAGVKVRALWADVVIDGIGYFFSGDEASVGYLNTYSGSVVIPEYVTYNNKRYRVTGIESGAFYECKGLTSVAIPGSVKWIGQAAFYHCTGLTSVNIPSSVTDIRDCAFESCSSLTTIAIPTSVKNIGGRAFAFCSGLTSFTIPKSVTNIKDATFWGCTGLTFINIPQSVTNIEQCAFQDCSALTSITIPEGVSSINQLTFSGCTSLTSVNTPESLTNVDYQAFKDCTSLTSIIIPDNVTSIGEEAFRNCEGLTSVTIGSGIKSFGNRAFNACPNITSVSIDCEYINNWFSDKENLQTLTLGNHVKTIGWHAFEGCSGLTSINIPENVTSIEESAFTNCRSLVSVNIPNSVTSIGKNVFLCCRSMTSISIGDGVASIADNAFYGCSALANVTIGKSVTSIGYHAFYDCTGLKEIYCYAEETPEVNSDTFGKEYGYIDRSNVILAVPDDAVEKYKAHPTWGQFGFVVPIGKYENTENVEIASAENLANFATRVNTGETSLCATLKDDIDFTTYHDVMIGIGISYRGDFDGAGHIIKLAQNRTSANAGLFCNLSGHVHDLTITGTITTSAKFAGGIAAQTENATIERCQSLVSINSSVNGDGTHGGIVGVSHAGTIVRDCLINGSITGSQTNCCAGVSGWADGVTTISNCLIKSSFTVGISGSDKLARHNSNVISSNNYFQGTWDAANDCGNVTSLTSSQVKSGEACFLLNNGCTGDEMAWYQTLGEDDYPVPDNRHKQVLYDEEKGYFNKVGAKEDLNGDGKVDIADAVSILNAMAESTGDMMYDVSGDGKVDIADFVTILDIMAQQ